MPRSSEMQRLPTPPWRGPLPAPVVQHPEAVSPRPRRVAIGNFDGVHLGHAAVIRGCDTVVTFEPHPLAVLAPDRAPAILTPLPAKAALLAGLGVRELILLPFDRTLARQSPETFVDELLVGRLGAVHVSVGANFRYGARAAGDVDSLRARPEFATSVAELVSVDGRPVSSSWIREALAAGDPTTAARLLGRPHRVSCRVVGFSRPAGVAHLELPAGHACPPPGVYECEVRSRDGVALRRVRILPVGRQGRVAARVLGHDDPAPGTVDLEFR